MANLYIYIYIYIHTYIHTYIDVYIYIYITLDSDNVNNIAEFFVILCAIIQLHWEK